MGTPKENGSMSGESRFGWEYISKVSFVESFWESFGIRWIMGHWRDFDQSQLWGSIVWICIQSCGVRNHVWDVVGYGDGVCFGISIKRVCFDGIIIKD
jgi:hypothetical protein